MGYRIPTDDQVLEAAREVVARTPEVATQHALARAVRHELQVQDPELRVGERRVRRLVLSHGLARLVVETGTTSQPTPEACPVCGEDLEQVRNRTLDGRETVVGARCPACPYRTGQHLEVPLRYEFHATREVLAPTKRQGPFG